MILAGDVGGTKTRLACFELENDRPKKISMEVYASSEYTSLVQIVDQFIQSHPQKIDRACLGIAGPVTNGISRTPNLPWVVDSRRLAVQLNLETVELINDLEANAHGISALREQDLVVLHPGSPKSEGNAALISAGTGLGESGLRWENGFYRPIASEAGHADFAPRNRLEIELLEYLLQSYGHVSYERVLSGAGLYHIYRFLVKTGRGNEPAWLRRALQEQDPAAVISQAALEKRAPVCEQALDLFVSIYGAEAGNAALRFLATGGIFVGGGIAPKIIEKLQEPPFLEAFRSKGRMSQLLEEVPVRVILNEETALLGAARLALSDATPAWSSSISPATPD